MAERTLSAKEDRGGNPGARFDYPFLILTLLLLTVGLAVLYSASAAQSAYDTGGRSEERRVGKECRL